MNSEEMTRATCERCGFKPNLEAINGQYGLGEENWLVRIDDAHILCIKCYYKDLQKMKEKDMIHLDKIEWKVTVDGQEYSDVLTINAGLSRNSEYDAIGETVGKQIAEVLKSLVIREE